MSLEAAFLSLVFVAFFTAAAFSMAAARVQQAVIHAHHIAKLTASSEWASQILERVPPGKGPRGSNDHLEWVIDRVNDAMEVQAHPTLKLGCGVTEDSAGTTFPRITNDAEIKGRGGGNLSWTEGAGGGGWSDFPVLRVETRCEVTLRATPGIPLPVGLANWDVGIVSYVPVECFVSTGAEGNLCG